MKYPITPEYIKRAPDILASYYRGMEDYILKDICDRFRLSESATPTALEHIRLLKRRGYSYAYIKRKLRDLLGITKTEYRRIMQNAVENNQKYYKSVLREQQLVQAKFNSFALQQEVKAIVDAAEEDLENITHSMGFSVKVGGERVFLPVAKAYQKLLSQAEVNVWSGAQTYTEAIRDVVRQLSDSGLEAVTYAKDGCVYRRDKLDVAVRRAVMTSITHIADKYTKEIIDEVPTCYFEVTAHSGARDKDVIGRPWANHKKWQGRVYSVLTNDKYPSIEDVCGFGEADGLEGVNCRHLRYPFWEGVSERTYTDKELENIDPAPFEFNGKKYSAYDASQHQRALERTIRAIKRNIVGFQAAGEEKAYLTATVKYQRYTDEYRRFCKAGNLKPEDDRMYVQEFGASNHTKAVKAYHAEQKRLAEQEKYAKMEQELRDTGAIRPSAKINMKPKDIDLKSIGFDEQHINAERYHNIEKEQAISWIKEALFSVSVWNGKFEQYFGRNGAVYVNLESNKIRTAFSEKEFDEKIIALLEVFNRNGD